LGIVRLPGRESRIAELPITDMNQAVKEVLKAIVTVGATRLAVFGHCSGALLGFELARALRREGMPGAELLIVAGQRAPDDARMETIADLPTEEFIREVAAMGGVPPEVLASPEMLDLVLPALRADIRMAESYSYRAEYPLDCPILALAGTRDAVAREDMLGWERHTSSTFEATVVEGDHFFVNQPPPRLATKLMEVRTKSRQG
jgi:medium-chain acyl-[acyl-carrier-protein] hydrolase